MSNRVRKTDEFERNPDAGWWDDRDIMAEVLFEGDFARDCREEGIEAAREGRCPEPSPWCWPGTSAWEAYERRLAAYNEELARVD